MAKFMRKLIGRAFRRLVVQLAVFRFAIRKRLLGFEQACLFLQRVEKESLRQILMKFGAAIGSDCDIETGLVFHNCMDFSNLTIGTNCHIGKQCFFDLRGPVTIGNNVVISMRCNFITHIDMEKSPMRQYYPSETSAIQVGDNCYLGIGATVLKGVELRQNTLVAAHAVVERDFSGNVVIGGVPARILKPISKKVVT